MALEGVRGGRTLAREQAKNEVRRRGQTCIGHPAQSTIHCAVLVLFQHQRETSGATHQETEGNGPGPTVAQCRRTGKVGSLMGTLKTTFERIPLEIINQGQVRLVDELFAPEYVERTPQPGTAPTREGFKQWVTALRTAFPDIRYTIDDSIEA